MGGKKYIISVTHIKLKINCFLFSHFQKIRKILLSDVHNSREECTTVSFKYCMYCSVLPPDLVLFSSQVLVFLLVCGNYVAKE